MAFSQPTLLTIDRNAGPTRIGILGEVGVTYNLESASSLSGSNWSFLLTTPLTNSPQSWYDAAGVSSRFYRAVKLDAPPAEWGDDFRLIDHLGRSRGLYYHSGDTSVLAVVLIFTGNGCPKVAEMMPTIKALTNRFTSQRVTFWLVDANQQDNRSNILAGAMSLGISNGPPILHDAAQLVARAYRATTTPEVVALDMADTSVFYRGAIDDRLGSNAVATTQHYLSNALVNFLAGRPVAPSRTRPAGCDIAFTPRLTTISYSMEIAPLLQDKCVRCHSAGNIAPFVMSDHGMVQSYAQSIKQELLAGRMPPWKADPYYSVCTNDFSLKPDQARKLVQWIDDGASKAPGEPDPLATTPTSTNFPFAWPASLGQPDAILRIPLQNIPASGVVDYRYLNVVNTAFPSNVWLKAAVVRPTNTRVVHHALVFDGTTQLQGLDGFFAGFVPGADPTAFPTGTGKRLTNSQVLQFQMHYISIGSNQTDQTEIGLYLLPAAPTYPLLTKSGFNATFSIPANARESQDIAKFPPPPLLNPGATPTLTTNILVYEMSPHMHLRGARFKYEVIYPAGHVPATEVILSVPRYDFHWQSMFRLAQPKYIPKGSRILCTSAWDNSALNLDLMEAYTQTGDARFSPVNSVSFGDQTYQEMCIGYINYAEVP